MQVTEKEVTLYYPKQRTAEVYAMGGKFAMITSFPVPRLGTLLQHFKFAPIAAKDFGERDEPGRLAFRLTPIDAAIREHVDNVCVIVDADLGLVLVFQLIDADGERTVIRFSDVKVNAGVDDARLRLELPAGAKVVHPLENLPPPEAGDPVGFK
jgi:hypothetical protein